MLDCGMSPALVSVAHVSVMPPALVSVAQCSEVAVSSLTMVCCWASLSTLLRVLSSCMHSVKPAINAKKRHVIKLSLSKFFGGAGLCITPDHPRQ